MEETENIEETKAAETEVPEIPYEVLLVRAAKNAHKYAPETEAKLYGDADVAAVGGVKKRTTTELVRDLTVAALLLLITVGSFFFFTQPLSMLGGVAERGAHENIYSFAFVSDNSIVKSCKELAHLESVFDESPIYAFMNMIRLFVYVVETLVVLMYVPVNIAYGAWAFYKRKSRRLANLLANNIWVGISVNVAFNTACAVSGGVGDAAYISGNVVGIGYNVCLIIGAAGCIVLNAVCFFAEKKYKKKEDIKRFAVTGMTSAAYCAMSFIFAAMPFYGLMLSTMSGFLSAVAAKFAVNRLLYPILNAIAAVMFIVIFNLLTSRFKTALTDGFGIGDRNWVEPKDESKAAKEAARTQKIVPLIVISAIAAVCVFLLRIPSIGLGWAVDIFEPTVAILIISVVLQAVKSIFEFVWDKYTNPKTAAPQSAQATTSAAK